MADGFAEVFPEHKYFIIEALQKSNHIVGIPAFVFAFLVVILVEDLLLSLPVLKATHKPEGQRPDLSQPRVNRGPRRTFFVRWGGETLGLWPPINQRAESPT
jgi:hypothetical protein